jgi:HK97 family phage major capsid protein
LFGTPIVAVEQCSALGTVGDIVLADLGQYLLIDRPPQVASSMHVRFVYDEMAFRFTYRVNGQPAWKSALTPYKGSNSLSPFVTLETRS